MDEGTIIYEDDGHTMRLDGGILWIRGPIDTTREIVRRLYQVDIISAVPRAIIVENGSLYHLVSGIHVGLFLTVSEEKARPEPKSFIDLLGLS